MVLITDSVPYPCLKMTSGAIYSGVPNTCLSLNILQSLSTDPSYKLVVTRRKENMMIGEGNGLGREGGLGRWEVEREWKGGREGGATRKGWW